MFNCRLIKEMLGAPKSSIAHLLSERESFGEESVASELCVVVLFNLGSLSPLFDLNFVMLLW